MMIEPYEKRYAKDVAELHINGIKTGFISTLGLGFVTVMYEAIAEDDNSFGSVAIQDGTVVGYITFSTSLGKLYKYILKKKMLYVASKIVLRIFSFSTLKKILSNIFYPSRSSKMNLPSAELLSIVIHEKARGKGIATELVKAGFDECKKRGIDRVKVLVADENKSANKMYQKCGFKKEMQIDSHGVLSNIYIADISLCN